MLRKNTNTRMQVSGWNQGDKQKSESPSYEINGAVHNMPDAWL